LGERLTSGLLLLIVISLTFLPDNQGGIVPTQGALLTGVVVRVVLPQALKVVAPILKFSGQSIFHLSPLLLQGNPMSPQTHHDLMNPQEGHLLGEGKRRVADMAFGYVLR